MLAGGSKYGPRQGADATESLATWVEEHWAELDLTNVDFGGLRCGIGAAAYTRHNNATYLRTAFTGEADVARAADLFDEAADLYADTLAALEDGVAAQSEAEQIANTLRDAAALEREIGQVFLTRGESR